MKWLNETIRNFLNSQRSFSFGSNEFKSNWNDSVLCVRWDQIPSHCTHWTILVSTAYELSHNNNTRRSDSFLSFSCSFADWVVWLRCFHPILWFVSWFLFYFIRTLLTFNDIDDDYNVDDHSGGRIRTGIGMIQSRHIVVRWLNYFSGTLCTKPSTTTGDQSMENQKSKRFKHMFRLVAFFSFLPHLYSGFHCNKILRSKILYACVCVFVYGWETRMRAQYDLNGKDTRNIGFCELGGTNSEKCVNKTSHVEKRQPA